MNYNQFNKLMNLFIKVNHFSKFHFPIITINNNFDPWQIFFYVKYFADFTNDTVIITCYWHRPTLKNYLKLFKFKIDFFFKLKWFND